MHLVDTMLHDGSFTAGKAQRQKALNFLHELGTGATLQNSAGLLGLLEKKPEGAPETEISRLKEAIEKLEAEKDAGLVQFYKLLKKASYLESRVISAEEESRVLRDEASRYEAERETYLQKKLLEAEHHVRRAGERVREAEDEIERLTNEVAKMEEERKQDVFSVLEKFGSMENQTDERLSFEIEKSVLLDFVEGIGYDADKLLSKNDILEKEKESLISQVKELHELVKGLKREYGQTLDRNEVLVLEKSVLLCLFGELKIDATQVEEERKVHQENFNDASWEALELETEAVKLNEILRQKEDERNEHEEKLKLELENLNVEFLEVRESYQNLQTQMVKVVQENMVLRKHFSGLKQQNLALNEDYVQQSELQLYEAEQNTVAAQNKKLPRENSVEVLNYGKKVISLDEQQFSEAVDIELLKETARLDRIVTVEKAVDYMKRLGSPDDMESDIKFSIPKTLAKELSYHCSCILDDRSVCTIQHSVPQKSYNGMKMAAPLWGLKIGKSKSKASSVNSDVQKDTFFDQNTKQADEKTERGREKKHKGRISDFVKKLHLKSYVPRSRSVTRQSETT